MGAVHLADLTLDVTHLIVGDCATPKYEYVAKHREDVKPMTMQWIGALRELWILDQGIDLALSERQHALPTFTSLRISLTGCDVPEERQDISDLIRQHGGQYEGDLTKKITHLISFRTEGGKYAAAKAWGLKIVTIDWLRASLHRGMILDEKLYDPLLPEDKRGVGAVIKPQRNQLNLGKRAREISLGSFDEGKRKLRRTASSKLSGQNAMIWGDIVGGGGSMVPQVARSGVWETADKSAEQTSPADADTPKESAAIGPVNTDATTQIASGLFSNCNFYCHGFTPKEFKILSGHLLSNNAEVLDTLEDFHHVLATSTPIRLYRVVPYNMHPSKIPSLPKSRRPVETVTLFWVERCLHHKQFFEPTEHVIGRPFPVFPISGLRDMKICSAGFRGIDLLHVQRAVDLLGATYCEEMTPETDVLVSKSVLGISVVKFKYTQDWSVPIVEAGWLWDSIAAGSKILLDNYLVRGKKSSTSTGLSKRAVSTNDLGSAVSRSEPGRRASTIASRPGPKPPKAAQLDGTAFASEGAIDLSAPTKKTLGAARPDSAFQDGSSPVVKNILPPAPMDHTAFASEKADKPAVLPKKAKKSEKEQSHPPDSEIAGTSGSPTNNPTSETEVLPLVEIDVNPARQSSASEASSPRPHSIPQEETQAISNTAISELLARTKKPATEGVQRRPRKQIIGRVPSNVSVASSVDSTATHGNPVEYPKTPHAGIERLPSIDDHNEYDDFMEPESNRGRKTNTNDDTQPPPTQLQYEDPESIEYRARAIAMMEGKDVDAAPGQKRKGMKERSKTIGDLVEEKQPRTRRKQKATTTPNYR